MVTTPIQKCPGTAGRLPESNRFLLWLFCALLHPQLCPCPTTSPLLLLHLPLPIPHAFPKFLHIWKTSAQRRCADFHTFWERRYVTDSLKSSDLSRPEDWLYNVLYRIPGGNYEFSWNICLALNAACINYLWVVTLNSVFFSNSFKKFRQAYAWRQLPTLIAAF